MNVPQTRIRLASSLSLLGVQQLTDSGFPTSPSDLTSLSGLLSLANVGFSFKPIGATDTFHTTQSATNYERRGLNSAREAFAIVPGPVMTNITMNRAVLYLEDALSAFAFAEGNIANQTRPLIIVQNTSFPDVPPEQLSSNKTSLQQLMNQPLGAGIALSSLVYLNCWFHESNISYDLHGNDQAVFQNVTMNCGRIVTAGTLVAEATGLGTVTRTLTENASITQAVGRLKI